MGLCAEKLNKTFMAWSTEIFGTVLRLVWETLPVVFLSHGTHFLFSGAFFLDTSCTKYVTGEQVFGSTTSIQRVIAMRKYFELNFFS